MTFLFLNETEGLEFGNEFRIRNINIISGRAKEVLDFQLDNFT